MALSWMLPALSAPEQAELVAGIRAAAPKAGFAALSEVARRVLPPAEWSRLESPSSGRPSWSVRWTPRAGPRAAAGSPSWSSPTARA